VTFSITAKVKCRQLLNKGVKSSQTHYTFRLALMHFYMQFKLKIKALNYPQKHTSCTISFQKRRLPIPPRVGN